MPDPGQVAIQRQRWRSGRHVGGQKPVVRVFVRKGRLRRSYKALAASEAYSFTPGLLSPNHVWFGEWTADTAWKEVGGVVDIKGDSDFGQNGVETLTITVQNTTLEQQSGLAGIFHRIKRGFMSPFMGHQGRFGSAVGTKNEWNGIWRDKATQIMVVGGYGDAVFPLFTGLLDTASLKSRPDQITATFRNMGVFLTDQRAFMDAKPLWVRDPITFADRLRSHERVNVANTAIAKSRRDGSPARLAVDEDEESAWISDAYDSADSNEWIEVSVPRGRYINFGLVPRFPNMEMFVSVYASGNGMDGPPKYGNGDSLGAGWVNTGKGNVPGTSIPYTARVQLGEGGGAFNLVDGRTIVVGDDSKVRLWFRNLRQVPGPSGSGGVYRAGVRDIKIWKRSIPDEVRQERWILVDDAADIVRCVLQWAGLHDWEVEDTGVRLSDKIVFDRQTTLADIIRWVAERTSYVFFIKPPADFDMDNLAADNPNNLSMGVAVFRQSSAVRQQLPPGEARETVNDTDLLTGIEPVFDNTQLPDSIRVRGKDKSQRAAERNPEWIHPLGADRKDRIQYSYRPHWARDGRSANLRRAVVHYEQMIEDLFEAKVACLMIAMRYALEATKMQVEFPMWPLVHLDSEVLVRDTGTGMSTRLWVASRSWEYQGGKNARFRMSVGGSCLDTEDITVTREEFERLLNHRGYMPAPIARGPWTEQREF